MLLHFFLYLVAIIPLPAALASGFFSLKICFHLSYKGWESGMLGMQKGGKRYIAIPPALAYGQKQVGSKVPANSTLVFEVDLLRVGF